MVEVIGLVTMSALVRVLIWSLGGESDAERRRIAAFSGRTQSDKASEPVTPVRRAAYELVAAVLAVGLRMLPDSELVCLCSV